jgi:hypothetical protein
MSSTNGFISLVRSFRGAIACAAAVEARRQPTRVNLLAAGMDPDAFRAIRQI